MQWLAGDVFHPGDDFAAFIGLLDGEVDHGAVGCGAVPVLFAGGEPGGIAGSEAFDLAAFALGFADSAEDEDHLPVRMRVPGGAGAGGERDDGAALGG